MYDSMFYSGSDTADLWKYTMNLFVGKYILDEKGRVIAYDFDAWFLLSPNPTPRHFTEKYAYDENGNRVWSGTNLYDDKVNLLSTHPILQFMHKDYSVNNYVPAMTYNKKGLPLVFDHTLPHPFNKGRFMSIGANRILYSCTD